MSWTASRRKYEHGHGSTTDVEFGIPSGRLATVGMKLGEHQTTSDNVVLKFAMHLVE